MLWGRLEIGVSSIFSTIMEDFSRIYLWWEEAHDILRRSCPKRTLRKRYPKVRYQSSLSTSNSRKLNHLEAVSGFGQVKFWLQSSW